MLTTVTSWLWIDIHRQIGVLYTAYTIHDHSKFCSLLFFFSVIHPTNQAAWKTKQVCLCHQYIYIYRSNRTIDTHTITNTHTYTHTHTHTHTRTHTHTHTQYSKLTQTNTYFRKIFEERGRVCVEQRTRSIFNPPPPPPRLSPFGWSQTIKPTLPSYTVPGGGGGGGVMIQPTRRRQQRQCHATKLDSQSSTQIV